MLLNLPLIFGRQNWSWNFLTLRNWGKYLAEVLEPFKAFETMMWNFIWVYIVLTSCVHQTIKRNHSPQEAASPIVESNIESPVGQKQTHRTGAGGHREAKDPEASSCYSDLYDLEQFPFGNLLLILDFKFLLLLFLHFIFKDDSLLKKTNSREWNSFVGYLLIIMSKESSLASIFLFIENTFEVIFLFLSISPKSIFPPSIFYLLFWDKVSLCSPYCLGTYYVT